MRVDGSTRYVGAARNEAMERRIRIERAKRVQKATRESETKPVGYYEERGMTKEDRETGSSITPAEAYRRKIAEMAKSPLYAKLQNESAEKKKEEEKETRTEESEKESER